MLNRHDRIHIAHNTLVDHGARRRVQETHLAKMSRLVIDRLVERGHIDAIDGEEAHKEFATSARTPLCPPCNEGIAELGQNLLGFPNHKEVKEVRNRFDVVDARPTAHDEGHILAALARIERNSREVKHIQHVRVNHLILQRETEEIKICNRTAAFKRKKRDAPRTHLLLHVDPRRIDALRRNVCAAVQNLIENGKPEIAHADLVDIGQRERESALHAVPVLAHGIPFAARIARRFQYRLQDTVIELHHCFVFPQNK